MNKFIKLWRHRYIKYTHIFSSYIHYYKTYIELNFIKYSKKKKLVLIVLTQQFGDIVAAEPLSKQIKEKHPDDIVCWIIKKPFAELINFNPYIDKIIIEFCAKYRLLLLKSSLFETVYNLQFKNNSHCPICDVWVENRNADEKDITIHNYYFKGNLLTVQQLLAGVPVVDFTPKIHFSGNEQKTIQNLNLPKKYIVIHAQSMQNSRNWDAQKWEQLIDWLLKNTKLHVVEVGLLSELHVNNSRYMNVSGKLSLLETAQVIKNALLFVGIDSGPSHLANAVGTKGLVLIGKLNDFTKHIPYSGKYKSGENLTLIRNVDGPSAEIELKTVTNELTNLLSPDLL